MRLKLIVNYDTIPYVCQRASGDCRRHREEMMREMERIIPECDASGRYKPLQCRPGVKPGGQKQCQCWSPMGDIVSNFPNQGYGNVVNCNCYFETYNYRNRGDRGRQITYGYGAGGAGGNGIIGRNFNELGWSPERQPACFPDGRYQVRRRCSTDGYCWCIDEYGMVKSDRRRDRNLICT